MSADLLLAATAALRDVGSVGQESMGDPVAESTRRRVMASIGEHKQGNRRRLAFAVFALALSTATLSWAASTGRLKDVLRQLHVVEAAPPRPVPVVGKESVVVLAAVRAQAPESEPAVAAVPVVVAEPVVVVAEPVRKASAKRVRTVAPSTSPSTTTGVGGDGDGDVAAYRKAHGVHFRGGDATAALAAWDEYLASHPRGRFVAEAAYNRAITLVRLGRKSEARAALEPFATGELGYRRDEAAKLREALK